MTSTLDLVDGEYAAQSSGYGTVIVREPAGPLTAAGIPVKPPAKWFANPNLSQVSPLTITADGQVYGHIAAWHTSHIGMAGGIKPPRSKSNYAFFRTGVVETAEGEFVDVGQITLAGGHASLEASAQSAVAHYDDTKSAIMDVAAGEDRYGIWVAGALRPNVTDEQIRTIRASSVSGDWRPINGRLELVAVCSVNCPGFPIPRARVASGTPIALVAAGIEPIVEQAIRTQADIDIESGIAAGLTLFRERVRNLEAILASTQMDQLRGRVHAATSAPAPTPTTAAADLRNRVHRPTVASLRAKVHGVKPEATVASLRDRVHGSTPTPTVASLRERVHGGDAAPFG